MKVLTYSSLFPLDNNQLVAPFIGERTDALSRVCELRIVSPKSSTHIRCTTTSETFRTHQVIRPTYLALPQPFKGLDGHLLYRYTLDTVRRLRDQFAFDIIDAHWAFPEGFAAVLLGRALKVPVSVTIRGSDVNRFLLDRRFRENVKSALSQAQCCIAVSDSLRAFALSQGVLQDNFHVIPNGVRSENFCPRSQTGARTKLHILSEDPIILYVGRLVPNKRLDLAIETIALLPRMRLYIIGETEGVYKNHLSALAKKVTEMSLEMSVTFVGPVPPDELDTWYSAASCVCLFSDMEGCPNVLLESLACGTPIVARRVGGVPEIARRVGQAAFIVDSDRPQEFADAIKECVETKWDRNEIGQQGALRTWTDVASEVAGLLRETVTR